MKGFGKSNLENNKRQMEKEYIRRVMRKLKDENVPTKDKRFTRSCIRYGFMSYDDRTLDGYYVGFINDILNSIRHGRTDFAYEEFQLKDLLRFEPELNVDYNDGVFYVCLSAKQKNLFKC